MTDMFHLCSIVDRTVNYEKRQHASAKYLL